jgi:Raf kinase inhibitor-like YbhB/YbcL family protein
MIKKAIFIVLICCTNIEATMKLISPAFSDNEAIPTQYTCDGANISPALAWSDAPENTASFALIVDDPVLRQAQDERGKGKPSKTWVHWIVFNIPPTIDSITENQASTRADVPFMQGSTDFKTQKWGGPCPPSGTHHYHFTLYALNKMLDLNPGATKEQLLQAMHGHILEQATLIGTYQRKK